MGTYTTHYNLFMPSVGEQGWGELVNGNFEIIDTTMSGLNTRMGTAETNITSLTTRMGTAEPIITSNTSRIGTLETESDALDSRIKVFEDGITINNDVVEGEFAGTLTGNVRGKLFVPATGTVTISYNSTPVGRFADFAASSVSSNSMYNSVSTDTYTFGEYELYDISYPFKLSPGLYLESENDIDFSAMTATQVVTVAVYLGSSNTRNVRVYLNGSEVYYKYNTYVSETLTYTLNIGDNIRAVVANGSASISAITGKELYLKAL